VHIPGWGDFQLAQLDAPEDPHPLITGTNRKDGADSEMEASNDRLLETADPKKQESLVSENVPDPMDAEQTWPTAEEMEEAESRMGKKKIVKKVPKGTSEYQAAWIPDSDGGMYKKLNFYFPTKQKNKQTNEQTKIKNLSFYQRAVVRRTRARKKMICLKRRFPMKNRNTEMLKEMIWNLSPCLRRQTAPNMTKIWILKRKSRLWKKLRVNDHIYCPCQLLTSF
jgi:hypothetical protein